MMLHHVPDTKFLMKFLTGILEDGWCPICLIGRVMIDEDKDLIGCPYCGQIFIEEPYNDQ